MLLDWLGNALIVIVATIGIVAAAWAAFHAVRQLLYWPKVPATILRYWITRSSEGSSFDTTAKGQPFYHAVLRFETQDGQLITTVSHEGYWRKRWPVGHRLSIRYNPANPLWVEIASFWSLWGLPLTIIALFLWFALIFWWLPMVMGVPNR